MKKKLTINREFRHSPFKESGGIEYFRFEEDFVEENVRCIPMIVRFKMDTAGIKLKLAEWSRFSVDERQELALKNCSTTEEAASYRLYLEELVKKYTGMEATPMEIDEQPLWANVYMIPGELLERVKDLKKELSLIQWRGLTDLQRFALLKLCRQGHESKNFIKALKEFNLTA